MSQVVPLAVSSPLRLQDVRREADALWLHCRNNLGIARLLVCEERHEALIATACQMAVECACRAALLNFERLYDGNVARALASLTAPSQLYWDFARAAAGTDLLAASGRIVAWVAAYLKSEVPDRSWGY